MECVYTRTTTVLLCARDSNKQQYTTAYNSRTKKKNKIQQTACQATSGSRSFIPTKQELQLIFQVENPPEKRLDEPLGSFESRAILFLLLRTTYCTYTSSVSFALLVFTCTNIQQGDDTLAILGDTIFYTVYSSVSARDRDRSWALFFVSRLLFFSFVCVFFFIPWKWTATTKK